MVHYFTWKLGLVSNILQLIVGALGTVAIYGNNCSCNKKNSLDNRSTNQETFYLAISAKIYHLFRRPPIQILVFFLITASFSLTFSSLFFYLFFFRVTVKDVMDKCRLKISSRKIKLRKEIKLINSAEKQFNWFIIKTVKRPLVSTMLFRNSAWIEKTQFWC